jgi:hypothetical protein
MSTWRTIYLILVILVACALINFIRRSADFPDFHIAKIFPFCSGEQVSLYDFAGLVIILMTVARIRRLKRAEAADGAASRFHSATPEQGRFRWWMIGVPVTLLLTAWLISGIRPSVCWPDVAQAAGSRDINAYGRLAILGIVLITVTLAFKCVNSK